MSETVQEQVVRELLETLATECEGACLYWQLPFTYEELERLQSEGVILIRDELVVHPDAVELEAGIAYVMPQGGYRC